MVNFCKFSEHFTFLPLIAMANIKSWVGKTTRNPVKNTKNHFYRAKAMKKTKNGNPAQCLFTICSTY